VLKHLAKELDTFDLKFEEFEWSSAYYKKHGKYLPDDALEVVKKFDAILFGAVGAPGLSSSSPCFIFALFIEGITRSYRNWANAGVL